jgi:hemoglobin
VTVYEAVGGADTFFKVVDAFYAEVSQDPVLRPLYPENLNPSKRRLALFLIQYFGGPPNYSLERGHPRLRARHLAFDIDQAARDAWIRHMTAAVGTLAIPGATRDEMLRYFEETASFLINR